MLIHFQTTHRVGHVHHGFSKVLGLSGRTTELNKLQGREASVGALSSSSEHLTVFYKSGRRQEESSDLPARGR